MRISALNMTIDYELFSELGFGNTKYLNNFGLWKQFRDWEKGDLYYT